MRVFVAMLCGYRRFLVYPTKANPNPVRLFNVDDFVDKLERDSRPFAEAMCDTQVKNGRYHTPHKYVPKTIPKRKLSDFVLILCQ